MNKTLLSSWIRPPLFLIPILMVLLSAIDAFPFTFPNDENPDAPWQISADHLDYDRANGIVTAEGNVIVTKNNSRISADFLEYSPAHDIAFARDRVIVTSKGDTLTADRMLLEVSTEKGTLYNSTLFLEANHLYIKGDKIEKTGEMSYKAERVSITTCDGENPDWRITGSKLNVTIEGYGTVFNSAFWTGKLPVLYTPFFAFPVKLKRQTGFLPPSFTLASERKGFEYFQPFFWAIGEQTDATFYLRHMEKRGDMFGTEYRYEPTRSISGIIMYDYLDDSKIDDGTEEATELWGYEDSPERTNTKRYWFRMKHRQTLPGDVSLKADADVVSDQDYLREFDDFDNGYDDTEKTFSKKFGTDIDTEDDAIRTNSLSFLKNWTTYSLEASLYWDDNVVARVNNEDDSTLQKLPAINFDASRQQLLNSPLYVSLESEHVYFYRKDPTQVLYKGFRSDIKPTIAAPVKLFNFLNIEPSISLRETNWHVSSDQGPEYSIDPETGETSILVSEDYRKLRGHHGRFIYETELELSTDIYRIFNVNIGAVDKIKHSVTTRLSHGFIPEKDQSDLPNFLDGPDRILKENLLTFSVTNYLTSRSGDSAKPPAKSGEDKRLFEYNQFCRFHLSQSYDINEKTERKKEDFINGETREEYLPLEIELDLTPKKWLSLDSAFQWSKYERGIVKSSILMALSDRRGDRISAEYSYERDSVESLISRLELQVYGGLKLYGSDEYNLLEEAHIERKAGMEYRSQCWALNLLYTDRVEERRYTLTFSLTGLGDLVTGSSAQSMEDYF